MRTSTIALLVMLCSFSQFSLGQTALSFSTNTPRHSDFLCKVEIPYIDAGDRGEDIAWQLGEIQILNK